MPRLFTSRRLWLLAAVVALILIQGGAAAVAAFATRDLFAALHQGTGLPYAAVVALALSGVVIGVTRVMARLRGEVIGQSYALDIRRALFDHGAAMSRKDVAMRRVGYTALRFVGDLTAMRNWPGLGLPRLAAALVLIPATLAVLGALHPPFLMATLPPFLAGLAVILYGGLRLPERHRLLRSRRAAIAADMAERMPIAPQLSALGRRATEARRIVKRSELMIDAALSRLSLAEGLKAVPDLLAGVLALSVIVSGWHSGAAPATIAGGLAAIGIALAPMRDLATVWNHLSAYRVARGKCAAALARPQRATTGGGKSLGAGPVSVGFDGLCAGPLRDLSCNVPAGAHIRLTGPCGSGKSLLLNLIAGLDGAEAGRILLNGHPIDAVSQGSLRRKIAHLTADPPILRGSLRRALTLGLDRRPSDDELLQAAKRFGLGRLIAARGGLDGKVAEAGRDLSEGQRVRIALLRAALQMPGLILLDAVHTRLDPEGQAALRDWLAESTATVVAVDPGNTLPMAYSDTINLGVG